MSSILTGFFNTQSDYKKLESDLENSGFGDSDYIVYLNDDHHSSYWASVEIKSNNHSETAQNAFADNFVLKTYLFENMTINEASYTNLKKFIDARSKAEIHTSPDVKRKLQHSGIDSEVKF